MSAAIYMLASDAPPIPWWEYKWLPEPSPGMATLFLIIVIALLTVLVGADIIATRRQRAAVKRRHWALFDGITQMHNLTPTEIEFLKRFVKYQPEQNPVAIVNSPVEYDSCVERELASLSTRAALEPEIDETLNLISSIRRKLALDNLPQGQFLHSTRGLLPNQEIKVRPAGKSDEREFDSVVVAVTEREVTVTAPRIKDEIYHVDPGTELEVNFVRKNDAIYLFKSRVLRTFVGRAPLVTISHTNDLQRIQLRRYYRVDVDVPLTVALLDRAEIQQSGDNDDESFAAAILGARTTGHCTLKNISGGGAFIESRNILSRGDFLNFDLDLWKGEKENITGEVVDVAISPARGLDAPDTPHMRMTAHLNFVGMNDKVRDKIVKYVFRRQLDNIRNARERVDEGVAKT